MYRKSITFILALVLILPILQAQQPGEISYKDTSVSPNGKVGERIQTLIKTVNSNDPDKIKLFLGEACTERFRKMAPMDQHVQVFQGFRAETGGVDFHSIRTYVPAREDETIVILKDRNYGSWRAFSIQFDNSNDKLIGSLSFNIARTPSNVTEPPLKEDQVIDEVREIVGRLSQNNTFSGTVLIAKKDKVLYSAAAGEASKRYHIPNNIDTKFNLGSMNKMFTSLSIMKLVEDGKLALDDTLDNYLDESWLPKDKTSKITIHHLLSHTSGLGSYFNRKYMESSRLLWEALDDYKPLVESERLAFTPGDRFRYSNTGMFLLGVVIEKVTGEDYFDYIRENIYSPAGMKNSDCYEMNRPVENLAIGYSPDPQNHWGWKNNIYDHVVKGGPAGGGFSTVKDLHLFAQAVLKEKYVSRKSLEKMWTDQAQSNYGYGFGIDEGPQGKIVGHSGGFSGINSNLDIFVDSGYIVAVMSNVDNGASPLATKIKELIERIK
ncbi:serine hydrolase domain-containing protein [Acidobacteriota bacterium]